MQELSRERLRIEEQVRLWAKESASDAKLAVAAPLILRIIKVLRDDLRQDLAKDQIDKAIAALWRRDQNAASEHIQLAFAGVAHRHVPIDWDELEEAARKLERGHPSDDPIRGD